MAAPLPQTWFEMSPVTVLLVEDEGLLAFALEEAFVDAGYEAVVAKDGNVAVRELEANPERFKAVVTDIRMPKGPDGWDVGHRARELMPTMAVVYMSGDSARDWVSKGVPNSLMLSKPFALDQAVTAVSQLLNNAPPQVF